MKIARSPRCELTTCSIPLSGAQTVKPSGFYCIPLAFTDLLSGVYRAKQRTGSRCTAKNRFIFDWRSIAESEQSKALPVEKAILRVHLKVIPRLLNQNRPTSVNLSVHMNILGRDESLRVPTGEHQLSVTSQSAEWMELNITQGVRSLWPPKLNESVIEVTILFTVNCQTSKKVPAIFEDPTIVPIHQKKRRQRLSALQPLFLVYLSDEHIKEIVRNETQPNSVEEEDKSDIAGLQRNKRSTNHQCSMENFYVNFNDLQLHYVLAPSAYNAKQCRGSCSHSTVSINSHLANNHAKIMASAKKLSEIRSDIQFLNAPKGPCCVPTKYSSLTLVIPKGQSIEYVVYPHMIVEECRCR